MKRTQLSPTHLLLVACVLLLALAYREVPAWDWGRTRDLDGDFFFDSANSSPHILLGVSALFVWTRIYRLRAALSQPGNWGIGVPVLLAGALLFGWATYSWALDLQVVSFLLVGTGAAFLLGGAGMARAVRAPLLILLLIVPPPPVLMNLLVDVMQLLSRDLSALLLRLLGFEVFTTGYMMLTKHKAFEVIETCSGTRALWTMVMSAFVYAEIFHLRGWRCWVLVALAPFVAFVINGFRILSIVFATDWGFANDHTLQGIVALVAGVLALHAVNGLLNRFWPPGPVPLEPRPKPSTHPFPPDLGARSATLAAVLLALNAWLVLAPRWDVPSRTGKWPVRLERKLGDWQSTELDRQKDFLGSVGFTRYLYRAYHVKDEPEEEVKAFVAYHDRVDRLSSLLSPKLAIPGPEYEVLGRKTVELGPGLPTVEETRSTFGGHFFLTYSWFEGTDGIADEVFRFTTALDNSPLRRVPGVLAVRLDTEVQSRRGAALEARARLTRFIELMQPGLNAVPVSRGPGR